MRSSHLRFTPEQEAKLGAYLSQRMESLRQDNAERIRTDLKAWARYDLDVRTRDAIDGDIWKLSNLPIPAFAMICEHFTSRCEDGTVAETPFFNFQAVNVLDEQKALVYDRYFNWKIADQAKAHEALLESNLPVFIQRAAILKATYLKEESTWSEYDVRVLHDIETEQPVEILDHGPIIEDDPDSAFEEQPDPLSVIAKEEPVKMRKHLRADPTFVFSDDQHYWDFPANGINRRHMLYCGPKSEQVSTERFFCPMDAASVDAADVVMELSDRTFAWFQAMWLERPDYSWATYGPQFVVGDAQPKTERTQDNLIGVTPDRRNPENRAYDTQNPVREVAEFWVRRDVLGDGKRDPQEFVVYMDVQLKVLVYYEWQAKICPDMRRPYTVTSLCKRPNRWCGESIWGRGERLFEAVDRLFNGEFYRTLQQGNPPKGGDPNATTDEVDTIEFNPNKYYPLKQGKTMDDLLSYAKVPDTNQRTQMVLEFIIFWIQLWLGVSNIAQGDYAAVPENSTKYGIQKTLQEASMLGRRWIRRKILSDEEHLTKLVKIAISTLPKNAQETFEFADGDTRQLAVLAAAEIKTLNVHVKIIESQHHEENDIERCNAALGVQERFFTQLNPEVRAAMRPLLSEMLIDLGFKNPDELLPDFMAMPLTESMMGGDPTKSGMPGVPGVQSTAVPKSEPEGAPSNANAS
jgi:hypothetical protein